jgi:YD repeat-containing protein
VFFPWRFVRVGVCALTLLSGISNSSGDGNLFINEILFDPPGSPDDPFEYIELRGAANEVLAANTFLFAVEGETNNAGKIRNYIDLSGKQIGGNGFLVLLQKGHSYAPISGSTILSNTAVVAGWGDGTDSSIGHDGEDGRTNLVGASVTFLLVRCGSTPSDQHLNIDANRDGTLDGEAAGWSILDGIGVLDDGAGDFGYGKINFVKSGGTSTATNKVMLTFKGSYVGRNGHTTGWASTDWVVGDVVTNAQPKWKLDTTKVHPTSRAGTPLGSLGGGNFGATYNATPILSCADALSGVVNHPGNPFLSVTASDTETGSNLLQVTATSLDTSSLPANRVTVAFTNSQWIVRFAPTNVCWSVPVRVRVSDGTNYSEEIVLYAASGLWSTNAAFHVGISDASTAIPLDTNYMMVADDEHPWLFLYSRSTPGLAIKQFTFTNSLNLTNLDEGEIAELDVEAASRFGNRLYWIASLGNLTDGQPAPNRNRLYATDLSGSGTNVQLTYVGRYDKLRQDLINWDTSGAHGKGASYYALSNGAAVLQPPKTNDGFAVEGLTFINGGGSNQVYLGLRAPLTPRGEWRRTLLVPVLNFASLVTNNPAAGPAQFGAPMELDLGGRAIRGMELINGTYWIVAGPAGATTGDPYEFRLFTWSGNALEAAQMWSADFSDIRPEGVVDVRTNGSTMEIQVIGDHGFSKLYQPLSNADAKDQIFGFRQFRMDWVPIGNPVPLQVMAANFAVTGASWFTRGSSSTNALLSIVGTLDSIQGLRLDDNGGNANTLYAGNNWTNELKHWNATNTVQPFLFKNPLAAFGSLSGLPTLYVGRTYRFHVAAGTAVGANRQALRITAYDRSTMREVAWQDLALPGPTDGSYPAFFERGLRLSLPTYGLESLIRPEFSGGAPLQEFTLEHRASKAEYVFAVSLSGQVSSNGVAVSLVLSNSTAAPSPLYVLNFDFEPAWQSHFLAQPHLHGEPAPSAYLGASVDELRATNFLNNVSLVVTQATSALTNIDTSPELRPHPELDRLVSDYDRDPISLANYVLNEVLLTDAFSPGAASSVLRSGGVRRGAMATYMEGQGSPLEQCALLIYLLRRCQVPAGYVFPSAGSVKLHQNMIERLFPFTIQFSSGTNTLVETDFPYVAAYVDGAWRVLAPWLKDLEVQEGLDLPDFMPLRYRTGRDWLMGYVRFDAEITRLATTGDTPATLLPRYLRQMLKDNFTGLTLEDFGVRVRARKHQYGRWNDFPLPAVVTGTNTVIESLATLVQTQAAYSNLFETVQVEVTSVTNTSRTLNTGKLRLLDLHNRMLELWFVETNGNHWMNLGLFPFRPDYTNVVSFSGASSLTSTQSLNELRDSVLLDSTDDQLTLRLSWTHFQPGTNAGAAVLPAVGLFQPNLASGATTIERKLRKGDLSTVFFDIGRVSTRMALGVAENLKRAQAATNSSGAYLRPEHVNGLNAYTIAAAYFQRTDAFRGPLARLYKTHVDGARSVAVTSLLAKRQANGVLLSGAIQLQRPRIDVCFREMSLVGNGTLRPGINAANERAAQDFLDLSALNEGAEEHQVLNLLYGRTNAVSTVRLLQLSQRQGLLSQRGILRLTATNYAAEGEVVYGTAPNNKKLKDFDPAMWQSIQTVFTSPGLSNAALVLMTPGEVNSEVGKRVGALILSPRYHAALLNPGLNDGEAPPPEEEAGSEPADEEFLERAAEVLEAVLQLFGDDGGWHDLEDFGHSLDSGDEVVAENPKLDDPLFDPAPTLTNVDVPETVQRILSPFEAEQVVAEVRYDIFERAELLRLYELSPFASDLELKAALEDFGYNDQGIWGAAQPLVIDPVNPITGEFYASETDFTLPGPLPLVINRSYSSRALGGGGDVGYNWKLNLHPFLVLGTYGTYIQATEPDGSVFVYRKIGTTTWKALWQDNRFYDNSSGPAGPARNLNNRIIERTNSATVTNFVVRPGDGSARVYTWRGFAKGAYSRARPWLSSWVDNRGNALRFEHGEDPLGFDYGKIRRVSSSSGAAVMLRYNSQGYISELVSKDGQRVGYSYNRWGDLIEVTRADGSVLEYEYLFKPSTNYGAVITNFVEGWIAFTNQAGLVDYQRGIVGTVKITNMVSTHRILQMTTPDGRVLRNQYDGKGRVVRQFANVGLDERLVRNATFIYSNNDTNKTARLVTGDTIVIDGLGNTNRHYYTKSKVTRVTDAEGIEELTNWDLDWVYHDPQDPWDPNWMATWYVQHPAGSYPRTKTSMTDRRGLVATFKYDSGGNVTNVTVKGDLLGDGNTNTTATTVMAYNFDNMLTKEILPNGTTNLYFYTNQWLLERVETWASNAVTAITNLHFYTTVTNSTNGFVSYGLLSSTVRAAGTSDAATNRFEYNERGYLTRVIRPTGTGDPDVVTTNVYNPRGWVEEQSDAAGRRTRFAYDGLGNVQQQQVFEAGAPQPLAWNFVHYNDHAQPVWLDGPRFGPEDYIFRDYDGGGRQTVEIKWRSRGKTDGSGVEAETGDNEFSISFASYDVFGNQTRATAPRGTVVSNRFDRIARLIRTEWYENGGVLLKTESFGYEPGGEVSVHTNAIGGYTLTSLNARGQPASRRNADGSTNAWRYYADGRIKREILRNGAYWETTYDDANRRVTRVFYSAAGSPLATNITEIDRRGNAVRKVDAGGFASTLTYDGLDRVKIAAGPIITNTPPAGAPELPGGPPPPTQQAVTNYYDAAGVVTTNVNALGEKTVTVVNALGDPTRVEIFSSSNTSVRVTEIVYDANHHGYTVWEGTGSNAIPTRSFTDNDGQNVLILRYPTNGLVEYDWQGYDRTGNQTERRRYSALNGQVTLWSTNLLVLDGLNRARKAIDRDGAVALFDYDAGDNLTNRVMPGGLIWRAAYNSAGQKLKDYNLGGSSLNRSNNFIYYPSNSPFAGLLQTRTDGRGVSCSYGYDAWLHVTTNIHSGSSAEHNVTNVLTYDPRELLTSATENFASSSTGPSTKLIRTYDAYGLLRRETISLGGVFMTSADQSWDSAGRRSSFGNGSFGFNLSWRADGRLSNFDGPTGDGSYAYDSAGLLLARNLGSRITTYSKRDGMGRPLSIITTINSLTRLTETLSWTGDGLLASQKLVRTNDFTDDRTYFYASGSRRLVEERLNLDNTRRWTNLFTFDNGQAALPGVITKVAQSATAASWSGSVDSFSRISSETNSYTIRTAYGVINGPGIVTNLLDGNPTPVSMTGTQGIEWRATMEVSPGAHQLIGAVTHPSGQFTAWATNWFTNNAANDLVSETHDKGGFITNRIWKNGSQTNRIQSLSWDARGRLYKVIDRDSTQSGRDWTAVYDAFNRLLRTTEIFVTNGVAVINQPFTIDHYYDPIAEFLEIGVKENAAPTTWKVLGPDLDGSYGTENGTGGFEAIVPGPELFCPLVTDSLGNSLAVYDQRHFTLMWSPSRLTAFGAVPGYRPAPVGQAGPNLSFKYAWRNRAASGAGYVYLGANWYDPISAQFLAFDEVGYAAGRHPYSPVLGDGYNYWDRDGRLGRGNYVQIDNQGIRQGNRYDDFYLGPGASRRGETVDRGWAYSLPFTDQPSSAFNGGSFRMAFGDGLTGLAEFAVNLNVGVVLAPVVAGHEVADAFTLAGQASVSGTAGERAYAYTRAAISLPMAILAFELMRPSVTPRTLAGRHAAWADDLNAINATVERLGQRALRESRGNWRTSEALFEQYLTGVQNRLSRTGSPLSVEIQPAAIPGVGRVPAFQQVGGRVFPTRGSRRLDAGIAGQNGNLVSGFDITLDPNKPSIVQYYQGAFGDIPIFDIRLP